MLRDLGGDRGFFVTPKDLTAEFREVPVPDRPDGARSLVLEFMDIRDGDAACEFASSYGLLRSPRSKKVPIGGLEV